MNFLADSHIMKEIDRCSIEVIGIPSMVLMERAAFCVTQYIINNESSCSKIIAVCGIGNNGGDGVAIARILHQKGYDVSIYVVGNEEKVTAETKSQIDIAKKIGVKFTNDFKFNEYNVIVDAIFGIGLAREITGIYKHVIDCINDSKDKIVYAVDAPSGICVDNGKIYNKAVKADYTVTFGLNKIGLLLYPANEYCGKIFVEDIGFPNNVVNNVLDELSSRMFCYKNTNLCDILPKRLNNSNKGTYGKILIVAGSYNMAGAAILASKAAYKMGAGLVKVFTCDDNREIIQNSVPEAILETYEGDCSNDIEEKLIKSIEWADCIVVGPGIGISDNAKIIVHLCLEKSEKPLIMDADALNIISRQSEFKIRNNVVLTPHLKEFSRMFKVDIEDVVENRLELLKKTYMDYLSSYNNCVMVMKDARTIVHDNSNTYVNISGNNGLSTAGSGDVLAGIIGALCAVYDNLFEAATKGVYIHGCAADNFVMSNNAYSLTASDIITSLDKILK